MIHGSKEEKNENIIQYWKSLRDYHNEPEMAEIKAREFMAGEDEPIDISEMSGVSRRKFLALLSASASFALASCAHPHLEEKIIPYNKRPEGVKEGIANYYASTCGGCANACGTLIKTREGRPIKVDGNPDHPVNMGKVCTKAQASILNLYDPERYKQPLKSNAKSDWATVDREIIQALNNSAGKEIAVIAHTITSPTTMKVLNDFRNKYSNVKFYSYELSNEGGVRSAWGKSYGTGTMPAVKLDQAKIILSLESDFLASEGNFIENMRMYAQNRDVLNNPKGFNKLYCVEGSMSITGMNADYRMRLRPDAQLDFVRALMSELGASGAGSAMSAADFASKYHVSSKVVENLVSDLRSNNGKAIVIAGGKLPEQVHLAVNALNNAIGASALYDWDKAGVTHLNPSTGQELEQLVSNMNSDRVAVVIHVGTNPVYHFPEDLGYTAALAKVPTVVTMAESSDETTAKSNYVLAINTAFESWGDHNTRAGLYSLQQPVIHSLYDTREKEAIFLTWIAGDTAAYKQDLYHEYLMNRWKGEVFNKVASGSDFNSFWNSALHDGVVVNASEKGTAGSFSGGALSGAANIEQTDGYIVLLEEGYFVGDGKFSNNGWLQEIPHPVSRVVWDNYASVSYATAKELDVDYGDMLEIKVGNRTVSLPAFIQPGMADKVVAVQMGYGRQNTGVVADGVGFNVNTLMSKDAEFSPFMYTNATVTKTGETYDLVSTQEHHTLEPNSLMENLIKDIHLKRRIVQEATYDDFINHKVHLHRHKPTNVSKPHTYEGVKWGMAIDLNKCTGCSACVASCNVENNLPVVGKDQVKKNREMQWIRVDRYYSGTPEEPNTSLQIMLCQHCDNAPCEYVCPVNATTHSPDGINQMVYQRCVGTRYCSNNCPYKVRRFNFFDYRKEFKDYYYHAESTKLLQNPEVTTRRRGVMEKCTFCIQRIMEARQDAINESRELKGTDVTVACQDACPSNAIQFGDINDPTSVVSQAAKHELAYYVLEDINTRPNVTYLAKLRNVEKTAVASHGAESTNEEHH